MVKIYIEKGVHIADAPDHLKRIIEKDLTFINPEYANMFSRGRFMNPNIPKFACFFSKNEQGIYFAPKGYVYGLIKHLKNLNIEYHIHDFTTKFDSIDFPFSGEARDYQQKAVEILKKYPVGVLESNTGSGKTFIGLNMIYERKQPALILVHSKELLYQWKDKIQQFMGLNCGLIGDGNSSIDLITVGIINSVRTRVDEIQSNFGHIIFDECHRTPAVTWTQTIRQFSAKYFLGLSATVQRRDTLKAVINACVGPTIHKIDAKKLYQSGAILKPTIIRQGTNFNNFSLGDSYQKCIEKMTKDESRNMLICQKVKYDMDTYGKQVLIASDRVSHCEELASMLRNMGFNPMVLTAKVNKKKRQGIVDSLKYQEKGILIATIPLIVEGFDAPKLHALFLTTPIKYEGRVIQIVGRVLRPEKGKVPRVYDFRDYNIRLFNQMGNARDKVYKKEKWI